VVNARYNQPEAETVAREARDLGVKAIPILADVKEAIMAMCKASIAQACSDTES
jgi:hypothetical protein